MLYILKVAAKMRIPLDILGAACDLFAICVNQNLAHDREKSHVVVVCMFIICQLLHTVHTLSDFALVIKVGV